MPPKLPQTFKGALLFAKIFGYSCRAHQFDACRPNHCLTKKSAGPTTNLLPLIQPDSVDSKNDCCMGKQISYTSLCLRCLLGSNCSHLQAGMFGWADPFILLSWHDQLQERASEPSLPRTSIGGPPISLVFLMPQPKWLVSRWESEHVELCAL